MDSQPGSVRLVVDSRLSCVIGPDASTAKVFCLVDGDSRAADASFVFAHASFRDGAFCELPWSNAQCEQLDSPDGDQRFLHAGMFHLSMYQKQHALVLQLLRQATAMMAVTLPWWLRSQGLRVGDTTLAQAVAVSDSRSLSGDDFSNVQRLLQDPAMAATLKHVWHSRWLLFQRRMSPAYARPELKCDSRIAPRPP